MCQSIKEEAKANAQKLGQSEFIRRISRLYPTQVYAEKGNVIAAITFLGPNRRFVDAKHFVADSRGLIPIEQAIDMALTLFEAGLYDEDWARRCKEIRKLRF